MKKTRLLSLCALICTGLPSMVTADTHQSLDGADSHFDNNYFDLVPGKPKTSTIKTDMPIDEFRSRLRLKSYVNS